MVYTFIQFPEKSCSKIDFLNKIKLERCITYIVQVAPTLVPLLKFYFHEEVRKAAVSGAILCAFELLSQFPISNSGMFCVLAMPELMRSAKLAVEKGLAQGRNETYIKQLSDYIVPALVEALHKVLI